MTQRNLHGDWTMIFENRIIQTDLTGSFNQEATVVYVNEIKEHVSSSPGGLALPWGVLQNCQHWESPRQPSQKPSKLWSRRKAQSTKTDEVSKIFNGEGGFFSKKSYKMAILNNFGKRM